MDLCKDFALNSAEWTEAALCSLIFSLHIPQVRRKNKTPTASATDPPVQILSELLTEVVHSSTRQQIK